MSKVENDLRLNPFILMNQALQVDFRTDKDVIGSSELHYGQKKLIIKKVFEIEEPATMRMLFGKVIHQLVEYKPVRTEIVKFINKKYGIDEEPESEAEGEKYIKITKTQKFRMHPDIITPHYIIEIKTTAMGVRNWTRESSVQWVKQLNDYVCSYKKEFGVLLVINMNAFLSASKDWDRIMNDYCYTLKFEPDHIQYDKDLELVEKLFQHIDKKEYNTLPCPEAEWECKYCYHETREKCGKEVYTCQMCKRKKIYEYPHFLTAKFKETPGCEKCFKKESPHAKYEKYKYEVY